MDVKEPSAHPQEPAAPLVRGRYRPLRLLRETLFGAVYLCEDTWGSHALPSPDAVEQVSVDSRHSPQRRHAQQKQQGGRFVVLKHVDLAVAAQVLKHNNEGGSDREIECEEDQEVREDGAVDAADAASSGHILPFVKKQDHAQAQPVLQQVEERGRERDLQQVPQTLDDPRQEKVAAHLLRRVGGHPNVVRYIDTFVDGLGGDFDDAGVKYGDNGGASGLDSIDTLNDNVFTVDGKHEDDSASSLFFVLEYCADGDLHEYLMAQHGPGGRLSPFDAMSVLAQVASGVAFVHALGLAHRDISLENVLLDCGVCKLSDFGLSASAAELRTERVGKAYYMAPEVVSVTATAPYDARAADVWSLGITFFILLTGSPLVPLASRSELSFAAFERHGVRAVLEAWGREKELSLSVTQLLEGMLAVDPSRRLTIQQVLRHRAFDEWESSFAAHVVEESQGVNGVVDQEQRHAWHRSPRSRPRSSTATMAQPDKRSSSASEVAP